MNQPPGTKGYVPPASILGEANSLVGLAVPVAIAQVGAMSMGLVDTFMVGRLGPLELAAVALGDMCFFTLQVVAMGILMALNPLVSQAHGAGDAKRCGAAWRAGIRLSLIMALPLALMILSLGPVMSGPLAQDPDVVRVAMEYLGPRTLGVLPQLLFVTNRSLFNGLGNTRPAMVVTLIAVPLNAFLDWVLIFGNLGAPALGVAGSGLGTAICRLLMCVGLFVWLSRPTYAVYASRGPVPRALLAKVFKIGLPIGLTHGIEVGAFAASSVYMGWLGVTALASHQIALKMSAMAFMLAISLGIATSVRVGNGLGAGKPLAAQRSAWTGIGVGVLCMFVTGSTYFLFGREIVSAFIDDDAVIELGASLMLIAAAFQLSDGIQAICGGALRGAGDTRRPMFAQIVAHWVFALPLGYLFAFNLGYGPQAVWWALAGGLTIAMLLLLNWVRGISTLR